jgi:hypothetical protein
MDNPMSAWEQIALLLPENGRHGKPWQDHSRAKVPRPGLKQLARGVQDACSKEG